MTHTNHDPKTDHCPALTTVKLISGKWKTRILWLLRTEQMQFHQLKKHLKGISAKMLTEHLRQLESDKLIYHIIVDQKNVRLSFYGYTDYGQTLIPVLDSMGQWGLMHEQEQC